MPEIKVFNGERLKAARIYRSMTIAELAEKSNVTKQAISQYENDKGNPSLETLLRLISTLGFPRDYFYEEDKDKVKVGNTYFRALLTTNKKDRLSQVEKTKVLSRIFHFLNKYIDFPELNIPKVDFDGNIEKIALQVRNHWGLGLEPIPNMVRLLEKNGFIITSFSTEGESIDAFSQRQEINGNVYYFIVVGSDKNSAVRRQFDSAHELGHIILHDWSLDLEQASREEFRQLEQEANQFAAALLLPKESFIRDLIYPNKLDFYVELKKKWKVSASAMVMRSHQLKVINYNQYQYLMRQISKRGWRRNEPLDDEIPIPQPSVLKKAIDVLITNDVLSGDQFIQQLSNNNLSLNKSEIEILLGLNEGALINKNQSSPILTLKRNPNYIEKM
ncbi:MAG: hypothetical protein JWM44_369 [Bacilli bacterium]|nr:hypothetical protein [Bacilli bacterium]